MRKRSCSLEQAGWGTYSTLHICVNAQTPKKNCLSLFEVTICHISDVSAIANISNKSYHSYTGWCVHHLISQV